MKKLWIVILLLALTPFVVSKLGDQFKKVSFPLFVRKIRAEALKKGISQKTINQYLTGLKEPKKQPIVSLKHQPQETISFQHYLENFAPPSSVRRGRLEMKKHRKTLLAVEKKYGVEPQFIIALWAAETEFGTMVGHDNIVHSLVTLAYQDHRADFYRKQLFAMLKILNHQKIPEQAIGTWDAGMGQPSFEPTIYLAYAVDFDGDGFKDIWTSLPDVFASIANFLHQNGWKKAAGWGYKIKLPKNFNTQLAGRDKQHSFTYWKKLGITKINGEPLEAKKTKAAVLLPAGKNGPAYLVFDNFFVLLRWNDTTFEGLSVGTLADEIAR